MAGFDSALGISPQVLALRSQRMNLLSANIANVDTPNYKARDIDFRAALNAASDQQTQQSVRHERHIAFDSAGNQPEVLYRQPSQLNLNGNTVEAHREHTEFMDNAIRYQVSLQLLDSRIKGLRAAIKGGQS